MLLFLSSNIPAAPAYGVYAVMEEPVPSSLSGLYSLRESAHYHRLLSQGRGIKDQTADNAKKFYMWHEYHFIPYNMAVSRIISDVFAIDKAIAYFLKTWTCVLPDTTLLLFRLMGMVGEAC